MVRLGQAEGNEEDTPENPEGNLRTRIPLVVGSAKTDSL